jgi:hypothetical protein
MERSRKLELIQRSLGLKHKLKVHDSMTRPETHEDLAITLLTKWELEEELQAIEELLSDLRQVNVSNKKQALLKGSSGFQREVRQAYPEQ